MRPRPVVGEATVPDAVRRLLDKFDYPDREEPAQIIPILPTLGGGGGGTPTVVVAASDASELSKSKADVVCPGVNDQDIIQAYIDDLETSLGLGRILLTEGNFIMAATPSLTIATGLVFQGMGINHTLIDITGTSGFPGLTGSGGCHFKDFGLTVSNGQGIAVNAGFGNTIDNVSIGADEDHIRVAGNRSLIQNVWIAGVGDGIVVVSGNNVTVISNHLLNAGSGIMIEGATTNVLVEGNVVNVHKHGIVLGGCSDCLIAANIIDEPGRGTDNTYDGILLSGNSDRNDIWNNKIIGKSAANQPRYGINVSAATCDDNSYLGNRTGPATDYGTGAYNDAGTATVNTWPGAAAPQGDNLL